MLNQLGSVGRSYKRESCKAMKRIVSEVYSPPRVTELLRTVTDGTLAPGFAFDLTCIDPDDGQPWDFNVAAKREKARAMLRRQRPLFIIGSPMCKAWCTWQALNATKRPSHVVQAELDEARLHLEFVVSLYREQLEGEDISSMDIPTERRPGKRSPSDHSLECRE